MKTQAPENDLVVFYSREAVSWIAKCYIITVYIIAYVVFQASGNVFTKCADGITNIGIEIFFLLLALWGTRWSTKLNRKHQVKESLLCIRYPSTKTAWGQLQNAVLQAGDISFKVHTLERPSLVTDVADDPSGLLQGTTATRHQLTTII